MEQMRVGVYPAFCAFIEVDQGGASTPTALNVIIQRVVCQVCLCSDKPLEGRWIPFQHAVPSTEPRQLVRGASPKSFWIFFACVDPLLHHRTDQVVQDGMRSGLIRHSLGYG